ncbi:hypothetical protein [Rheinheimera oceanensis]|uniref:hypothetical protein n=1 Tax=Rheinheimera oceanensis TaxID=2817449 RepID=UPI001BFEC06D|nr:hypothetical protein [Rheinheimera oceanensis]
MKYQEPTILKDAGFSIGMLNRLRELDVDVESIASFTTNSLQNSIRDYDEKTPPITLFCSWLNTILKHTFQSQFNFPVTHNILNKHNGTPVTFKSILSFCWQSGIPVIPLDRLKSAFQLPSYVITWDNDRPVIFLSSEGNSESGNLYKLAHALMSAEKQELKNKPYVSHELAFCWGGFSHIYKKNASCSEIDIHEKVMRLVTKNKVVDLKDLASITFPGQLALECDIMGEILEVDPGILALMVADSYLSWDLVKESLEYLDEPNHISIVKSLFEESSMRDERCMSDSCLAFTIFALTGKHRVS